MQKILLKIANIFVVLAILVVIAKPRGRPMNKIISVVKNGFTASNLTQSQTTGIAIGLSAASLDQYLQIVPEQYRPVVHAIAIIVLFFYNRKKS